MPTTFKLLDDKEEKAKKESLLKFLMSKGCLSSPAKQQLFLDNSFTVTYT